MSRRSRDQSSGSVVLADQFSALGNPRGSHGHAVHKEINPEKSVNGRQTTAEIWCPNYQWNVRSQAAMMDCQTRRVRLFECVQNHVSSSENAPPNPSFWGELTSSQSKERGVVHHNALAGRRNASKDGRGSSRDRHRTNSEISRHRNTGIRDGQVLCEGKRATSSARPGYIHGKTTAVDVSRKQSDAPQLMSSSTHSNVYRSSRACQED